VSIGAAATERDDDVGAGGVAPKFSYSAFNSATSGSAGRRRSRLPVVPQQLLDSVHQAEGARLGKGHQHGASAGQQARQGRQGPDSYTLRTGLKNSSDMVASTGLFDVVQRQVEHVEVAKTPTRIPQTARSTRTAWSLRFLRYLRPHNHYVASLIQGVSGTSVRYRMFASSVRLGCRGRLQRSDSLQVEFVDSVKPKFAS